MHPFARLIVLACLVIAALPGVAPLVAETIYLPAEEFSSSDGAWTTKGHFKAWYTGRPDGRMLYGNTGTKGDAVQAVQVEAGGDYRLWLRYLAVGSHRGPFEVSVSQGGRAVATRTFDEGRPDGIQRHASFVWVDLPVSLKPGSARIAVRQVGPTKASWLTRHLDAFVLSNETEEEPNIVDFLPPLYVQARMGDDHPEPAVIHVFGRRPYRPWYLPHQNLGRQGLINGANSGTGGEYKLKAGEASPWVNVTPLLAVDGLHRINFSAIRRYQQGLDASSFELVFSTTPSEEGELARFRRSGAGSSLLVTIDPSELDQLRSGVEWSAEALAEARALPEAAGRRPTRFPVGTGVQAGNNPATIANEAAVMAELGINATTPHSALAGDPGITHAIDGKYIFHLVHNKTIAEPDVEAIHSTLESELNHLARSPLKDAVAWFNLMDEPYAPGIGSLAKSKVASENFIVYLKERGYSPSDLGATGWDEVVPSNDRSKPRLFVESVRFRHEVMANLFEIGTRFIESKRPDLRTTTNFANSFTYEGNMLARDDWFRIMRSGALTHGLTEDWLNHSTTYQFAGLLADMMRSATRGHGQPFAMYNILRKPWEVEAKAAAEIARGADALYFFNYGPIYANTSDQNSHRYQIYPAIQHVSYAIGAVEDVLLGSKVAPARVAQLYAHSTDTWTLGTKYPVQGKERLHLWLLARHLNEPIDILTEDDVAAGGLDAYEALLLPETHISGQAADAIARWVRAGGVLVIGPGSAQHDELNQPLDMLTELGLQFERLDALGSAGRDIFELPKQKAVAKVAARGEALPAVIATQAYAPARGVDATVLAHFDDGKPAATRVEVGEGQVVAIGFFPGLTYGHVAVNAYQAAEEAKSPRLNPNLPHAQQGHFPAAMRELLAEALSPLGPPTIETSEPLVQADVRVGDDASVLVLTNWTGQKLDRVTVTLRGDLARAQSFVAVRAEHVDVRRDADIVTLTLPVQAFEFITMSGE